MELIDLIGAVVLMCGVILIYDARPIAKKIFSFSDQNSGVKGMKIVGFVLSIIGGLIILL